MSREHIRDLAVSSRVTCPLHAETMKLYCYDCDLLICRDCTLLDHRQHRFEFLTKCAPETRGELNQLTLPLRKIQADISVAEKRVEGLDARLGEQETQVGATITATFDKMRAVLDAREMELTNKLNKMVEMRRSSLEGQRSVLLSAESSIRVALDSFQETLENASSGDVMALRTKLQAQLEEEREKHTDLPLKPEVMADISCDLPPADLPKSEVGDIFQATIDQQPIGVVGTCSTMCLVIKASKNLSRLTVNASLLSLAFPKAATQVMVIPKGQGKYEITFVPQVRGRHQLQVKVNEGHVPGSPFSVFVKIPPVRLGIPVIQSDPAGRPYGIALSPRGEIVVAENGGKKLTFMDKNCRKLHSISSKKFYYPRGIAVGRDNAVFSTDKGNSQTILKFVNGKLVKGIDKGTREVRLLKIINDYLYVCDTGASEVFILTQDLDVIKTFPTPEVPSPHSLAEGEDGLYIVSQAKGGKIGIYSHDGIFLRYFTIKSTPAVQLSGMKDICFDAYGNVFITQAGEGVGGVYVFSPEGNFISSFALVSSGLTGHPLGVVIDEDGLVYISDHKFAEMRVFIF